MTKLLIGEREPLTTGKSDLTCTVCRRPKNSLRPRKSKLITGMQMFLCNECFDGKREPRFAVIMVARDPQRGLREVKDYIRNHRYYGDKIKAEELV